MEVSGQPHTPATVSRASGTHCVKGCVDPTANLEVMEKVKISCTYREMKLNYYVAAHSLVTYRLS
jgi:hypothetical protein